MCAFPKPEPVQPLKNCKLSQFYTTYWPNAVYNILIFTLYCFCSKCKINHIKLFDYKMIQGLCHHNSNYDLTMTKLVWPPSIYNHFYCFVTVSSSFISFLHCIALEQCSSTVHSKMTGFLICMLTVLSLLFNHFCLNTLTFKSIFRMELGNSLTVQPR